MKRAVAFLIVALSAGCAADVSGHHCGNCADGYEWVIVPMQVGGHSDNGGGAMLINKRTGETWGFSNGQWVPVPRLSSPAKTQPTTQPSLF